MAEVKQVECSFVSRAPVAQMYHIYSTTLPLLSTICPNMFSSVDLLEGRWGNQGCVILWNYNYQGKVSIEKDIMEVIDKKNNRIVYKVIEGGPLDVYKSFTWIFQTCPNDNVALWILEYEKDDEDVPEPTLYLDLLMSMMEQIDDYLISGP